MISYVIVESKRTVNFIFLVLKKKSECRYLLFQDIRVHVEWQYFDVVHRSTDRAYYDVGEHLVNDSFRVVLEQWNRSFSNDSHSLSNHK